MKAKTIKLKGLALLIATLTIFVSWGVGSADFHNGYDCVDCHDITGGVQNLSLVADYVPWDADCDPDPSACGLAVTFTAVPGGYGGGPLDLPNDGICEVCHAYSATSENGTKYYTNDGNAQDHPEVTVGEYTGGPPGTDCMQCHSHCNSFSHCGDPGTGCHASQSHLTHTEATAKGPDALVCNDCHKMSDESTSYEMAVIVADGKCNSCHSPGGAFDGVNDATVGVVGNWTDGIYKADGETLKAGKEQWCATCHDNSPAFSRSEAGSEAGSDVVVDNEDPGFSIDAGTWKTWTTDCIYVGSNFNYHLASTEDYSVTWQVPADMPAGTYRVYAIWCANRYREDQVSYTINDSSGPNIVGPFNQKENNGIWVDLGCGTQTFTFNAGSGSVVLSGSNNDGIVHAEAIKFENIASAGAFAPNVVGDNADYGYYITGHKVACATCHDTSKNHIDHDPRTYEVDEATGDAVNAYENGYRLKDVLGERPMVIPRDADLIIDPDPCDFALCFRCHDSDAILPSSPDGTNFYHHDGSPQNSHWIHLRMGGPFCDSDWDAIIGGVNGASMDSSATCTTCHNVHGSTSPTMIRTGELISTAALDKTPALDFCYHIDPQDPPPPAKSADCAGFRDCNLEEPFPNSLGGNMNMQAAYPEGGNGVCKHCHTGYQTCYYRAAKEIQMPANPLVSEVQALPSTVANNGAIPVLFTARVFDPNDDLSSVTINLSPLGGPANQTMYDNGTNGDETEGDGIYSYRLSGTSVEIDNYTVTITAADSLSNTDTGDVVVAVSDQYGAYIVDNEDSALFSVTGNWETWDQNCVHSGTNFHYHPSGPGSYSATWQVRSDMPAGTYKVYAIWCANAYRDDDVYYTINHSGGPTVVGPFNQKQQNGVWVDLGRGTHTFTLDAASGSVIVSGTDSDGVVGADAVKFQLVYQISGRITESGSGLNGVTVDLTGSITDSTTTSGDGNYSFWVPEGTYTLTPSRTLYEFTPPSIVDLQVAGADEPNQDFTAILSWTGEMVVDNEDPEFSIDAGTWKTWTTNCIYVGSNFNYHLAGTEDYSVTWQVPADMPAGTYRVSAIWCANRYREDQVSYTINDSSGPHPVGPFNQKQDNGIWVDLGGGTQTFTFNAGAGSVVLSGSNNDGVVHAEAIKFEQQ